MKKEKAENFQQALYEKAVNLFGRDNQEKCEILLLEITNLFGGQLFYFQKKSPIFLNQRNLKIFYEFTGRNHTELAQKYGLSENRIYEIIREVKNQQKLST